MNSVLRNPRIVFAGLLGAAMLTGSPLSAQAEQGKWWDPKQGGSDQETRYRDGRDGRDPRDARSGDRGLHRGWYRGGPRFQRDVVVIRDGYRGPRYRAHRIYVRPAYFYRQHLVVIRPVRYYFTAGAAIGGVRIQARFHDHDQFLYGCNFCDARFDSYGAYYRHVLRCDDRPRGYRFDVSDWDDDWTQDACDYDSHYGDDGRYHDEDLDR